MANKLFQVLNVLVYMTAKIILTKCLYYCFRAYIDGSFLTCVCVCKIDVVTQKQNITLNINLWSL